MSPRVLAVAAVILAALGVVLVVAGRGHTGAPVTAAPSAASSPTTAATGAPGDPLPAESTSSPISTPSPVALAPQEGDVDEPVTVAPPSAEEAPIVAAGRAVADAYARPGRGVTQQQWWDRLQVLLSDQARSDYLYVQGSTSPYTEVIADPIVAPHEQGEDSHLSATVLVPTDAGTFEVRLITVDGQTWLGARITRVDDEYEPKQ